MWSAPSVRTRSTFFVLHTPVTFAPSDLAICTANVPTPPDAPLISDPLPRLHLRRRPAGPSGRCSPASGTAAACSNVRLAGLASPRSPAPDVLGERSGASPYTSSPGLTAGPPARRLPPPGEVRAADLLWVAEPERRRSISRATYGSPRMTCQSRALTAPPGPARAPRCRRPGLVDLSDLQRLRRAVPSCHDRLHALTLSAGRRRHIRTIPSRPPGLPQQRRPLVIIRIIIGLPFDWTPGGGLRCPGNAYYCGGLIPWRTRPPPD